MNMLRNAGFNLVGALLPAVALFLTIPLIVQRLGADAYGSLVLITSIVGYFGIIDVNATAGSVKYVAEYHASGAKTKVNEVITFGLLLYLLIGAVGAVALWFGADILVHSVFKIPEIWQNEANLALQVSAASFFVSQFQLYLQSIPQALHRYDLSGRLDAIFGSLIPLVTMVAVLVGGGLVSIVSARLAVSLVHCLLLVSLLRQLLPQFRPIKPTRLTMSKVSSFSSYAYLQRIASITYINADKVLIAAQHSMLALAIYVIPYTLMSRIFAVLYRLTQGMFPLASALAATGNLVDLRSKYIFAKRYTVYLNACVCITFSLFAQEVLFYWLGKNLGESAPLILILVAYGMFLESLTNVPSLVNDGLGRPHITGAAAALRIPIGLAATWWALKYYDIVVLALSQLVVSAVLSIGFLVVVHRISLPWTLASVARPIYFPGGFVLAVGTVAIFWRYGKLPMTPTEFTCGAFLVVTLLATLGWLAVLSREHRQLLFGTVMGWLAR